ncbi:hypothetical protein FOL47_003651 [Perkinsus chesapeaki]|uniref:Uncharacterized protein n=1 Tax=Perkinsus chesapeaki TaxID=330153 RepID=A0A7J6M6X9_PERCH|nr:hypothetical protein FOL47_003651 [Perkinsus chesapeaki]
MSESLPEIPSLGGGAEHRPAGLIDGGASSPSSSISSMVPHVTSLSNHQLHEPSPPPPPSSSASQLYPIMDTSSHHSMMDDDGSYGQQEKSPPELLEAIGGGDVLDASSGGVTSSGDGENPVFMSMMGAAMAAAQLQNMNQQIQWQQYMLLQQQQALIAHAQMKRAGAAAGGGGGKASATSPPRPPALSGEGPATVEAQLPSPAVGSVQHSSAGGGGMSGQLTAALLSAGVHSPGSSSPSVANSDDTKTLDLGVITPKADTSPTASVVGSNDDHMAESEVGTLPLVAITEDCSLDGGPDNGDDMKCNEFTLEVAPDTQAVAAAAVGGADGNMQGVDTQTWQQFQQLQYNQWSYAAAMSSNPWYYGGGYPGTRGYGQGGEMMRPDGMRSSSSAAAEAVAGIKRRKKPYAAPKGVWRNNGGYNATIYVNKKRIYGPLRRNLADAVSDRRVMEDSVDSARAKVERMIEEQHKTFESDQARESFIAEESHTMIREVVAKLRAERGTHNSASGAADPRPSVQNSMSSQQSRRPGVVPSLAQAVYGTARPGNMMSMPFMMPYPSTMWPRPMASTSRSPPLPRPSRKRDRSVAKEEAGRSGVKLDSTKLADSVLFGGSGQSSLSTTDIEIAADPPGAGGDGGDGTASAVTPSDAKRARTLPTTSTSTTASSYVPLSPLFNPGSPPLSSRMFSSALPKYLRSPAFPATQITPSRMPSFGPSNGDGPMMDDDIQLEDSAIGGSSSSSAVGVDGSVYGKAVPSFGYALSPTFMPYQTTMSSATVVSYPQTTGAVAATSTATSASSASSSTTAATTPTANNNSNNIAAATCLTFANSPGLQPSSAASFWTPHLQYLKHSPAFASQSSSAAEG